MAVACLMEAYTFAVPSSSGPVAGKWDLEGLLGWDSGAAPSQISDGSFIPLTDPQHSSGGHAALMLLALLCICILFQANVISTSSINCLLHLTLSRQVYSGILHCCSQFCTEGASRPDLAYIAGICRSRCPSMYTA